MPDKKFDFSPTNLRRKILEMAYGAQCVHIACAMSVVEILSVLHDLILHYPNNQADSPDRDFFVLSKGHGVMAQYACMHSRGWLADSHLSGYLKNGSPLKALCESNVDGCEVSSGSLGHGLPIAVGIAIGLQKLGKNSKVYCLVGDGELNEGSNWEAVLLAGHLGLSNLIVIVDANGFQALGKTDEILRLRPLRTKFEAFNFAAIGANGHDLVSLKSSFELALAINGPSVVIAETIKGFGISFMENKNDWHYKRLTSEELESAVNELLGEG